MTMAVLAHQLLHSQRLSHQAADAERAIRAKPELDTPAARQAIAESYALARHCAGQFVAMSHFFAAANDA